MAYAWYTCLEPRVMVPAVVERYPDLTEPEVQAVARGVVRAVCTAEGVALRNSADGAISAVADDYKRWRVLADAVLDMAGEAQELRTEGGKGAPVRERATYTDEELLHGLRKLAEEYGRTPTIREIREAPELPNEQAYYYRFGGLAAAMRAAGLNPRANGERPTRSDRELLRILRDRCRRFGGSPSMREFDRLGTPKAATYIRRFGSWNEALERIKYPTRNPGTRSVVPLDRDE